MRIAAYPGYVRHKAEHDRFIGDLLTLSEEHDRNGAGAFMALKASHWLTQWLKQHVSGTDAELGRFLSRGKPR
jgi:hemerythrin